MNFGIKILIVIVILAVGGTYAYFLQHKAKTSELFERVDAAILKYDTFGQEVAFRDVYLNKVRFFLSI